MKLTIGDLLPKPVSGSSPEAVWLQRLTNWLRSKTVVPGPDYRIHQKPHGIVLELLAKGGASQSPVLPQLFQVQVQNDDSLVCDQVQWQADGTLLNLTTTAANAITVALPWELRAKQKPYPSAIITPGFQPTQSLILGLNVGYGVTGIAGVPFIYLNLEGRTWGDIFVVCTDGVPKNRTIPATKPV